MARIAGGLTRRSHASLMPLVVPRPISPEQARAYRSSGTTASPKTALHTHNMHIIEAKGVTNRPEDLARDRERLMQGLTETKAFPGLAGKFGFNQEGDGVKDAYVMMMKNGRWVQVDFAPAR